MQHPDEGTIHAWIDGELSADDGSTLEGHLAECADCSALTAEARGLAAASSRIVKALDMVPGDVIPKPQTRHRPWYASTQLRAAAAVVIVAGASLLVMRERGVNRMERAVQESAPPGVASDAPTVAPMAIAAQPRVDSAAAQIAAPSIKRPARVAQKTSPKSEPEADSRANFGRRVAADEISAAAARAPEKIIDAPASVSVTRDQLSLREDVRLELKKIRIDSAKNETVYEVVPGAEVTLTDNGQAARIMLRATAQAKERRLAAPTAPLPPMDNAVVGAAAAKVAVIDSISWTDKRGHMMILKGAFSKPELQAIRQKLPEDQR